MVKDDNNKQQLELAARVSDALKSLGRGGKRRIAEKCGVTEQAVTGWLKTGRIQKDNIVIVAEESGYNLTWLITGNGNKKGVSTTKASLQAESALMMGEFDVWDDDTPLHEDDVELPFFREVELAAGSGRTQVQENHGLKLRFSKRTLKRQGVEINHAACVTVSGNSMEPAMPDGCTIGIDTSKTQINNGKMYAIDHDGELRVKMLYKMPGGLIRLRSYNHEEWPDETVSANAIKILGKVFWYSVLL